MSPTETSARLKSVLIGTSTDLRKAARIIDDHPSIGMAVVTESDGTFAGVMTSGDIFRAIFGGANLDQSVEKFVKKDSVSLSRIDLDNQGTVRGKIRQLLERNGRCIPIVDEHRKVIDLLTFTELETEVNSDVRAGRLNQRVLVIGGAGYLGIAMVEQLVEKGYTVRVLDNFTHRNFSLYQLPKQDQIEIVHGDIRDIRTVVSALEGVNSVILLAAVVGDPASQKNPKETVEINYLASKMIAEAAKFAGISRFLFASTCSVYGAGTDVLDENSPLNPVSHYARTKIAAEQAVLSLGDAQFQPTVMRLSTLFGLSQRMRFDLVVNVFALHAVRKGVVELHGGKQWRPLVHLRDAARAFVMALEAPREKVGNQVFNVGSEKLNYQIAQLAEITKQTVPGTQISLKPSGEDARDYRVSFNRIREAIGFEPQISIESSIREISDYVKSRPGEDFTASTYANHSLDY